MHTQKGIVLGTSTACVGIAILVLCGCEATTTGTTSLSSSPTGGHSTSPSTSHSVSPPEIEVDVLETVDGLPPAYADFSLPPAHFPVPLAFTDPDKDGVLWIAVWGSSTCPTVPVTYSVSAHRALTVTLGSIYTDTIPAPDDRYACTDDLTPTSTAITVPDNVGTSSVTLRELSTITIPVRPHPATTSTADRTSAPAPSSASPVPSEGPVTVLKTVAGLPPGITESPLPPEHSPVPLAFTDPDDARVLWISSWGSSSCPSIPTAYSTTPAQGVLTLTLEPDHSKAVLSDGHAICTADLALMSTSITLPDDAEIPAEVTLREYEIVTIPVHPESSK